MARKVRDPCSPCSSSAVMTVAGLRIIVVAMDSNFYPTLTQVWPVLLLVLICYSAYLTRLRRQQRPLRREDPTGVWFWTKPAFALTH